MVRTKFVGTGREREGGYSATHKQDFIAHITGGDFRHGALDIDMEPPLSGMSSATTVQATLELLAGSSSGQGFVTIGDDYNNCSQDLALGFAEAFADTRLVNGGIVFVKAGTYCQQSTVTVPTGITIMGEPEGTIIVGETAEQSLFIIQTCTVFSPVGAGGFTMLEARDKNRISNIIFYDDLNNASAGGPPSMSTTGFISCQRGSNLMVDGCQFIGKAQAGAVTHRVVKYIGSASLNATVLRFNGNFVDGVKCAIEFDATLGRLDKLVVENNSMRTFGNGIATDTENNYAISFSNAGVTINDNYHIGTNPTYRSRGFVFIKNVVVSDTDTDITIVGNKGRITGSNGSFLYDARATKTELNIASLNSWGAPTVGANSGSKAIINNITSNGTTSGNVTTARGVVNHTFAHRYMDHSFNTASATYSLDLANVAHAPGTPGVGFGALKIVVFAALSSPVTVNIDAIAGAIPFGAFFEVVVENLYGSDITMVWSSEFAFSSAGDDQFGTANEIPQAIVRWTGLNIVAASQGPTLLMDRKDYRL